MLEQRFSDNDVSRRDIPSFIEPRPPLIQNPFMRPRPQKGTNLLELFDEDSEIEEPEWLQVYLRMKPCRVPNTLYEVRSERCLVTSLDTATAGHGRRTQHNVSKMYTFSKIFGAECNQKEIFEAVVKDNLKKLPEGQNFTLLTYGASGSGKTYTLMGTVGAPGLVPRSLEYVFRLVDAAQQPAFRPAESGAEKLSYAEQDYELQWVKRLRHVSAPLRDKYRRMSAQLHSDLTVSSIDLSNRIRHYVWVSFVEIYNEAVYDLLAPPEKRTKLRIREDTIGNVYVKGATQAFVRTGEEAYDVMVAGKHNLVVAATGVHAHSSRSHCIFTITMLTETGEGSVRTSYVRLCDLAGCERARATRNTGARMAESRAINSSLHVLERCLHMLRRKQRARHDAMVPYRESKLTRLLGTGLSGSRGEAVSMVVTLNPSPEYAHETKHVLSLAAVAQDIQINNTMLTTTLESSKQETTINCSSEVMKLRADNERLHFELVQAQARNKEILAAMEERQQESANTMRELVEEAKDLTKQYYEAQMEALRYEMEDMIEEYEARLAKAAVPPPSRNSGTPSRFLQAKVAQLMTEIAVLEEKLTAEHLARARAEKEVEHLRTCIEERDERAFKDTTPPREDVMSISDSEQESEEENNDPLNESLEPIFKKELDKSLSIILQKDKRDTASIHTIDNIDEECDSDLEKSHDTLKNNNDSNHSTYATGEDEDSDLSKKVDALKDNADDVHNNIDDSVKSDTNISYDDEVISDKIENSMKNYVNRTYNNEMTNDTSCNESFKNDRRDNNDNTDVQFKNESLTSSKHDLRGTYFISDSKIDFTEDTNKPKKNSSRGTYCVKDALSTVLKSSESDLPKQSADIFKVPITREKSNTDIVPEKVAESLKSKTVEEQSNLYIKANESENQQWAVGNVNNSESNIDIASEKTSESITNKIIRAKSNVEMKVSKTISETLVSKIMRSFKSNQGSDVSLRQFEQLEKASKECNDDVRESKSVFCDIKILKDKRTYFDDVPAKDIEHEGIRVEEPVIKEKRTYFDNIYENVAISNKKLNEVMKIDDDRSPSIVKDMVSDNFEPTTIKKLLGDNLTKPDIISSIHKPRLTKKHNSVDIFDGFDSPVASKPKEIVDNVEIARQSIEKMVLEQQLSANKGDKELRLSIKEIIEPNNEVQNDIKKEMKLEPMSSVEESNECQVVIKLEPAPSIDEPNQTMNDSRARDNTIEAFENIYKDITAPRATEFELLVSQEMNESSEKHDKEDTKYNLRKKTNKGDSIKIDRSKDEEILAESQAKCESKARKRNLRLRRKKNEESDDKLKDIVNLQSEFSDVTLDVPAPHKVVKDIPSPEKGRAGEENLPPLMGIQSCPSKREVRNSKRSLRSKRHVFET